MQRQRSEASLCTTGATVVHIAWVDFAHALRMTDQAQSKEIVDFLRETRCLAGWRFRVRDLSQLD